MATVCASLVARCARGTLHCMAFAKTPKRLELAVNSVNFKIGLKFSSFKKIPNLQICNFLPNDTFLPEFRTARNRTWVYGVTSNHLHQ
jgi:hypothetical protein